MGFEYQGGVHRIAFDDGPLTGLEVYVRSAGAEAVIAVQRLRDLNGELAAFGECIEVFARLLIQWNLTEGGVAVPCNRDELMLRNTGLVIELFQRWVLDVRKAISPDDVTEDEEFDESELPMVSLEAVS